MTELAKFPVRCDTNDSFGPVAVHATFSPDGDPRASFSMMSLPEAITGVEAGKSYVFTISTADADSAPAPSTPPVTPAP